MFKTILATAVILLALTIQANTLPAPLVKCSCTQTFEDFQGFETDITAHVTCPAAIKSNLECGSKISSKTFTVACVNTENGEHTFTKTNLTSWEKPVHGMTFCELN